MLKSSGKPATPTTYLDRQPCELSAIKSERSQGTIPACCKQIGKFDTEHKKNERNADPVFPVLRAPPRYLFYRPMTVGSGETIIWQESDFWGAFEVQVWVFPLVAAGSQLVSGTRVVSGSWNIGGFQNVGSQNDKARQCPKTS